MNYTDKLIQLTEIMESDRIGRATKLAFEYVEKTLRADFVFIAENSDSDDSGVGEQFANNRLFCCVNSEELEGTLKDEFEKRGSKAGMQYAVFESGVYKGYIAADDLNNTRPDWAANSEEAGFFRLAAEYIAMKLFSDRNRANLNKLMGEWNTYRNALMVNSEYVYFADLTENMISGSPIYKNPEGCPGKVDCEYPISLDAYLDLWHGTHNITPVDTDFNLNVTYCDNLIKAYSEGRKVVEFEYSLERDKVFRRKTILLDSNADGHIIATTIISDIDEVRQNELRINVGKRERKNLYNALANLYCSMFKIKLSDGSVTLMQCSDFLKDRIEANTSTEAFYDYYINDVIDADKNAEIRGFCDFSTIKDRLANAEFVNIEVNTKSLGWVLFFILAFNRDENGEVTDVLWVTRRIDGRKQKELEMTKSLAEALDRAQKASEAKTHFLSSMSHDIRTPMNGIIGMTELAKNNIHKTEKVKDCLAKISISSNHLLTLINDILELSRIESGKINVNSELVDLREIAQSCMAVTDSTTLGRNLKTEIIFDDMDNPYVYSDGLRIRQCVINVVSNAMKYTPDGGSVSVHFGNKKLDDDCMMLSCVVKDTGIGMTEEFVKKIFQPFSQANEASPRTKYEGSGLGMAIVKETMDMLGGTVEISSQVGVGTTVTLKAPVKIAQKEDVERDTKKRREYVSNTDTLEGLCVLIAEDNDINREVATELLEGKGITVIQAVDGNDAVTKFCEAKANSIDCILMDIMMPSMDGYTATAVIRNLEREDAKKVPILALSANAFAEDIKKSEAAGMNGHLSKPIEIDRVTKAILQNLREKE